MHIKNPERWGNKKSVIKKKLRLLKIYNARIKSPELNCLNLYISHILHMIPPLMHQCFDHTGRHRVIIMSGPKVQLSKEASLRGFVTHARGSDKPVNAFLGIPYAAPPIMDRRFKPPQPVALWDGERDATKYGE